MRHGSFFIFVSQGERLRDKVSHSLTRRRIVGKSVFPWSAWEGSQGDRLVPKSKREGEKKEQRVE